MKEMFTTEDIPFKEVAKVQRVSSNSTLSIDRLFYRPLTFVNVVPFVLFQSKRGGYKLMPTERKTEVCLLKAKRGREDSNKNCNYHKDQFKHSHSLP